MSQCEEVGCGGVEDAGRARAAARTAVAGMAGDVLVAAAWRRMTGRRRVRRGFRGGGRRRGRRRRRRRRRGEKGGRGDGGGGGGDGDGGGGDGDGGGGDGDGGGGGGDSSRTDTSSLYHDIGAICRTHPLFRPDGTRSARGKTTAARCLCLHPDRLCFLRRARVNFVLCAAHRQRAPNRGPRKSSYPTVWSRSPSFPSRFPTAPSCRRT